MAAGAVSSVRDTPHDVRWKWLLLGLCGLGFVVAFASTVDALGFGGSPWYGYWDATISATDKPFVILMAQPVPGGASDRAGLRDGDRIDLRRQSLDSRTRIMYQPITTQPAVLTVLRSGRMFLVRVTGSTVWQGQSAWKLPNWIINAITDLGFLGCALLIATRSRLSRDARTLTLVLLSSIFAGSITVANLVIPNVQVNYVLNVVACACGLAFNVLLVVLSSRFGNRTPWRGVLEWFTYGINALSFGGCIAGTIGIVTLWFDPVPYDLGGLWRIVNDVSIGAVAVCAVVAVASTARSERSRAAWLLLPLPLSTAVGNVIGDVGGAASWYLYLFALTVANAVGLLGAIAVTYALLKRRVVDIGLVLSRTIVVSIVGLIVVIAFVLLEWMLGSVLTGVSHATGLIANAALALVIGVSLNYIHKRVDQSVDLVLFRKRHEDEQSLLAFSKEAAYITEWDALLDATLEKVRRHTDAGSASVLIGANGFYSAVRSFGNNTVLSVNENDEAVLALKVWHKPIDPHQYDTALHAALALPMLSRGKLYGVLVLGERTGGEAYAPDEVEALSQLANGVGSALEALSLTTDGSARAMADYVAGLHHAIESLAETMVSEIQKLRASSLT